MTLPWGRGGSGRQTPLPACEEDEPWEGGDEGVGGEQMSDSSRRSKPSGEGSEWDEVVCC